MTHCEAKVWLSRLNLEGERVGAAPAGGEVDCPFCLLQREYRYFGYPMYGALLGGSVLGMGAGLLALFRSVPSLSQAVPALQRQLAGAALALLALLAAIVAWSVLASNLRM